MPGVEMLVHPFIGMHPAVKRVLPGVDDEPRHQ